MFKSRLLNQTLAGVLIPLILVVIFSYIQVSGLFTHLRQNVVSEVEVTSMQIQREFQLVLDMTHQLALMLALNSELVEAFENRRNDFLYQWGRRLVDSGLVSTVTYIDEEGIVLARGHDEFGFNDSLAQTREFETASKGRPFSGLTKKDDQWVLQTILPVFQYEVLFRGVVVVEKTISTSFLSRMEQAYAVKSITLGTPKDTKNGPVSFDNGILTNHHHLELDHPEGIQCVLTIVEDISQQMLEIQSLKNKLLLFIILITLVAVIFIVLSMRYSLRPIQQMHAHLKRMHHGNTQFSELIDRMKQIKIHKSELGLIAKSVSDTLIQLQQSQLKLETSHKEAVEARQATLAANEELHLMHQHLEELVNERTSELLIRTDQLKEEIREREKAEKRYRFLVENATDAIFIVQNGLIKFPNPKTIEMFGYTRDQLESTAFQELIEKADKEEVLCQLKACAHNGESSDIYSSTFRMIRPDSTPWLAQLNTVSTVWEGQPALLNFIRDITEQNRKQEILIQSEKMLSVGGLAAGMAHEINNPLAGMMQNAQVAMHRLLNDQPANVAAAEKAGISMDKVRAYTTARNIDQLLNRIRMAGKQAAGIVENMLSFASKSDSRRKYMNLTEIVEKTLRLAQSDYNLGEKFDFKRIEIVREYAEESPFVKCEESKIQQVVFNIIKNATEAIKESKNQTRVPRITIRISKEGRLVRMEIEDNGPGMEDGVRKKVFEPFFTTKPVDKGTGLGLSVSYFIIVEDHKGNMEVRSTPGTGSTFIIELPLGAVGEDLIS